MPYTKESVKTDEGYELLRGERRSFYCHNKLWEELKRKTNGMCSISQYIKIAITEKIERDNLKNENKLF